MALTLADRSLGKMVAWRHFLCAFFSSSTGKWQLLSLWQFRRVSRYRRLKKRAAEAVEVNDVATCFLLVVFPLDDDDGRPAVAVEVVAPPAT